MANRLGRLLQPPVVIGLVLSAVLLAFLFQWTDVTKVGLAIERFSPILLPVIFLLVVVREAIRVIEWRLLLGALGMRPDWRHGLLAFLGGDASQILPAGIYFENYLLQQADGSNVATSLAATLAMQLIEAALALVVLGSIGVPSWLWLRPAVLIVGGGYALFLFLVTRAGTHAWLERWRGEGGAVKWLINELDRFLQGISALARPGVIFRAMTLTAAYLAFTIAAFFVVIKAYGLSGIGVTEAAAIYAFVLAIIILNPLPSDLGVSELSGVAIFVAFGIAPVQGLTVMLISRFCILFSTEIIAGLTFLTLRFGWPRPDSWRRSSLNTSQVDSALRGTEELRR